MTVVAKVSSGAVDLALSSGTVAFTVIDTVKVIEHAVRRAGSSASTLTPEQLDAAYDNLYLILTSMVNRGVNLWCLEEVLLPLYINQAKYALPVGTVSVVEARYRTVQPATATWGTQPTVKATTLSEALTARTFGMLMRVDGTFNFALEYKNSSGAWVKLAEIKAQAKVGEWVWLDIDNPQTSREFRVRELNNLSFFVSDYVLADQYSEQPMMAYNRDDYVGIANKNVAGAPLNYLYEKQITPIMTIWPVPNNTKNVLVVTRQRQVQDVGPLLSKLEIPERWYECIIWMLAKNMAYELPNMTTERITLCTTQAAESLREAELGESDGAPMRILPNISGYTA